MKLSETFSASESRVKRVILFIDITESTAMKEKTSEASWLTTYGWFFDLIAENVSDKDGGSIVKYLGDGVMIAYEIDKAANAINSAICIQEAVLEAANRNEVFVNCSVGIATGEVVEFQTMNGNFDYIGLVADRAARLCSKASPKAIFVDRATVSAALMVNVRSKYGNVVNRTDDEYAGNVEKLTLKGFSVPVPYHEILWHGQYYGLKSEVGTESANTIEKMKPIVVSEPSHKQEYHRDHKNCGTVTRWLSEFGFVSDSKTHESFYVNGDFMAGTNMPKEGDHVYFLIHDALGAGKNRVASCLTVIGDTMRGTVTFVNEERGFGYVAVSDTTNNQMALFVYLGSNPNNIKRGDLIEFQVEDNPKGPVAKNSVKIENS